MDKRLKFGFSGISPTRLPFDTPAARSVPPSDTKLKASLAFRLRKYTPLVLERGEQPSTAEPGYCAVSKHIDLCERKPPSRNDKSGAYSIHFSEPEDIGEYSPEDEQLEEVELSLEYEVEAEQDAEDEDHSTGDDDNNAQTTEKDPETVEGFQSLGLQDEAITDKSKSPEEVTNADYSKTAVFPVDGEDTAPVTFIARRALAPKESFVSRANTLLRTSPSRTRQSEIDRSELLRLKANVVDKYADTRKVLGWGPTTSHSARKKFVTVTVPMAALKKRVQTAVSRPGNTSAKRVFERGVNVITNSTRPDAKRNWALASGDRFHFAPKTLVFLSSAVTSRPAATQPASSHIRAPPRNHSPQMYSTSNPAPLNNNNNGNGNGQPTFMNQQYYAQIQQQKQLQHQNNNSLKKEEFINTTGQDWRAQGFDLGKQNDALMSPASAPLQLDFNGGQRAMAVSPFGTPNNGVFYSMAVPAVGFNNVQNQNGQNQQQQQQGSLGTSFGSYGQSPMNSAQSLDPLHTTDENGVRQSVEAINEKRRKRRESHNAVERRRRDNINLKIQELSTLLPEFASDAQNKPNKGVILRRSVEYIRHMQVFAARQMDRTLELEQCLMRVCEARGIEESELGLGMPLGTPIQLPALAQHSSLDDVDGADMD